MAIPILARNDVPLPPAGFYSLFFDSNNSNILTYQDSQAVFVALPQQLFDPLAISKINDCLCEIVSQTNKDLSCAAAKGVISMLSSRRGMILSICMAMCSSIPAQDLRRHPLQRLHDSFLAW